MRPVSGSSKPAIILSSVVLPQPEGPSRVTNSPDPMERLTSSTATRLPKRRVRLHSSRSAMFQFFRQDDWACRTRVPHPDELWSRRACNPRHIDTRKLDSARPNVPSQNVFNLRPRSSECLQDQPE